MSTRSSGHVRPLRDADIGAAHALLSDHGWAHRIGSPAQFAALVPASQRVAVAESNRVVVGFGRALTDGQANGYLSMVVVAPAMRGHGIGRDMVAHLTGDDPGLTWVLRAGRDGAPGFFARLGFSTSTTAMERRRAGAGPSPRGGPASGPIAAVMVPVDDVAAALDWYRRAFPAAKTIGVAAPAFECLDLDGVRIEIVPADAKVAAGASGSVVYWCVASLDDALAHFQDLGAALYRGPMAIENDQSMCQVRDPWGNCIGLRGPHRKGDPA